MEKQYEVRIEVAYTVDAEDEEGAKEKAEKLMNEITGPYGLEVMFQVGNAECLED